MKFVYYKILMLASYLGIVQIHPRHQDICVCSGIADCWNKINLSGSMPQPRSVAVILRILSDNSCGFCKKYTYVYLLKMK